MLPDAPLVAALQDRAATDFAVAYRVQGGLLQNAVEMAVVVQEMSAAGSDPGRPAKPLRAATTAREAWRL